MINIEKFQSEIQKNMQAMVNEHTKIVRENRELEDKVKQLENQPLAINVVKIDKEAVVIFAADVSGSMDSWERMAGKEYAEELLSVLSERYKSVSTRHIHHHTEAKLVNKGDFLAKNESGGTIVSSAYRLINKELEDFDYDNENLDVFVVHISDGDNLTSDNLRVSKVIEKVFKKVTKVIYVEVSPFTKNSALLNGRNGLKSIENDKFSYGIIKNIDEVDTLVRGFATLHLN